jgi:hypothetical protein
MMDEGAVQSLERAVAEREVAAVELERCLQAGEEEAKGVVDGLAQYEAERGLLLWRVLKGALRSQGGVEARVGAASARCRNLLGRLEKLSVAQVFMLWL